MKTFHQFIRAVYAAFAGVCGAFCAPVLNLKGGGGQKLAAPQ